MEDLLIDQEQIDEGIVYEPIEDDFTDNSDFTISTNNIKVDKLIREEIVLDERAQNNQSDISILSSNDVNDNSSSEVIYLTNNYITYVSGNEVSTSWNLINKPLNEYTPTESMFAFSILLGLGVVFAILCRKAVLRWR